jgi:hypothetical protein
MKHPTVPAPKHIKPVLREVLVSIKEVMEGKEYRGFPRTQRCLYICRRLKAIPGKEAADAINFIQACLDDANAPGSEASLGCWQVDNDPGWLNVPDGMEDHYENLTRVAWLEWLTKEDSNAAPENSKP